MIIRYLNKLAFAQWDEIFCISHLNDNSWLKAEKWSDNLFFDRFCLLFACPDKIRTCQYGHLDLIFRPPRGRGGHKKGNPGRSSNYKNFWQCNRHCGNNVDVVVSRVHALKRDCDINLNVDKDANASDGILEWMRRFTKPFTFILFCLGLALDPKVQNSLENVILTCSYTFDIFLSLF